MRIECGQNHFTIQQIVLFFVRIREQIIVR